MKIPADTRTKVWRNPNTGEVGQFRPTGSKRFIEPVLLRNPETWGWKDPKKSGDIFAARVFVGLSVGDAPAWKMDDVVALCAEIREAQGRRKDASFIAQKGIYTSRRDGSTVVEDSVQIVIIGMEPAVKNKRAALDQFTEEMIAFGEDVCRRMAQEEVVIEIQKNGLMVRTLGVEP